jgi:TonB family protein
VFEDARRRLLPQIFQERYDSAKAAFEQKNFQAAADQFQSLVSLLGDPAMKGEDSRADLRTVVSAFSDLARAAALTQKPQAALPAPAPPPDLELAAAVAPRVYVAGSAGVVPPVAISKSLPPLPRTSAVVLPRNHVGVLDIIVNELGNVTEVTVRKSIHPQYDKKLVESVRAWKFKPAMKDGQPVSFRSVFEVKLAQ